MKMNPNVANASLESSTIDLGLRSDANQCQIAAALLHCCMQLVTEARIGNSGVMLHASLLKRTLVWNELMNVPSASKSLAGRSVVTMAMAVIFLFLEFSASFAQVAPRAAPAAVTLPGLKLWAGDLDGMLKRRIVRVLTPFNQTDFFIDRGRQMGVNAEFARALEDWLNKRHARSHLRQHVVMVPMPRDRLFTALAEGRGDVIMANLTITPERQAIVDFSAPRLTRVKEIVVVGPASPRLERLDDLAGQILPIRPGSSYASHIAVLSNRLQQEGKAAIRITPLSDTLEDEQILAMVNAGLLPLAVVDDHRARLWAAVHPKLQLRNDLVINDGGEIAWAIRKGSPLLRAELDAFLEEHRTGTGFGSTVHRRYFGGARAVRGATTANELKKYEALAASFRTHAGATSLDPLLLAAQGYQESQLVQARRSPRGAVGIMQLLPSTAAAAPVSVNNVADSADANIMAGARYMRHLMDKYVNDPGPDPLNRLLMTFAAYNAGPGNLRKFRREASAMGLDPNVWANNVEQGAAKIVGRETVQYVANIYKYYLAYDLVRRNFAPSSVEVR
jgi:membrane-bound lytic murein transglycosylase MltF